MAMASVSWASALIEPKLIAPLAKRLTIDSTGSTSSSGTGRTGAGAQREEAAQRRLVAPLVVDGLRVVLEELVPLRARGVLQLEHRLRVEEVQLAVAAPLVLPAGHELAVGLRPPASRRGRG